MSRLNSLSAGWRVTLIIIAGVALHFPTLNWGLFADDYSHQVVLRDIGEPFSMRPWNLYNFPPMPAKDTELWRSGGFPWWTDANWKIKFFRPLTSLSLWADYFVFGDWAAGYHITSLALFAVILWLVYRLYLAIGMSAGISQLALLLFAVEDSSLFPVGWPANRNTLLAVLFIVAALLVLVRRRTAPTLWTWITVWVLALLACLSKESGVLAFVLVAFVSLSVCRRVKIASRRHSITCAAISLIIGVIYFSLLTAAGYGENSVFYASPWKDFGLYFSRVGLLFSTSILSYINLGVLDLWVLKPQLVWIAVPVGLVVTALFIRLIIKRTLDHPALGFLVTWVILTLTIQAAAPPSERLLFAPSVGVCALFAILLYPILTQTLSVRKKLRHRCLRSMILILLVFLPSFFLLAGADSIGKMSLDIRKTIVEADVGSQELGSREVFLLQVQNSLVAFGALATWAIETSDANVRFWPMQIGRRDLRWTRIDENTFDLQTLEQPFLTSLFEIVYLESSFTPNESKQWETALFTVESIESDEEGLKWFRVRCNDNIDDLRYRFVVYREGRLRRIAPPEIGESINLSAVKPADPFVP